MTENPTLASLTIVVVIATLAVTRVTGFTEPNMAITTA